MSESTKETVWHDVPAVGDIAVHRTRELDGRRVQKIGEGPVDEGSWSAIWILIGDSDCGPLPAENYRYTTQKEI